MNWLGLLKNWRYVAIVLFCIFVWWKISSLQNQLSLEQSKHKNTQTALADAVQKGKGWQLSYETMRTAAEANGQAIQACLDREVLAQKAMQEREIILLADTPRERTETDKKQVVHDATRKRVADRLNRSW